MDPVAPDAEPIKVVISYRRDDASGHAGHLYADLVERFGEQRVFIDIDNIEPGLDFAEVITDAIKSADVFIAVIGRYWLSAADRNGRRKIDKDDDFVRLEIEAAIKKKLRILPVLVQDAEMPSTEDLPASLATFSRRNALEISDKRWRDDVAELVRLLEGIARTKAQREATKHAPAPQPVRESEQAGALRAAAEAAQRERELAAAEHAEAARRDREAQLTPALPLPPVPSAPPSPPPPPPRPERPVEWSTTVPAGPPPANPKVWLIGVVAAVAVVLAAVAVAVFVSAGNSGDSGGSPGDTTGQPEVVTKTVDVLGDVLWNDTGIDVVEGQTVEIVASGTVETAKGSPSRDSEPDGKPGEENGNNVIPGVRHGALIGMIGSGQPFEIGAYKVGPVPASGRLYLGVNDKGFENNAGSYQATITVV